MHISNIPPWFNHIAFTAMPWVAMWRGGTRERAMGAVIWVISLNGSMHFLHPPIDGLFDDLVCLTVALACLVGSRSYWTVWVCAGLLVSVAADLVYLARPSVGLWGYRSTDLVFWYATNAVLVVGALAPRRDPVTAGRGPAGVIGLGSLAPAAHAHR